MAQRKRKNNRLRSLEKRFPALMQAKLVLIFVIIIAAFTIPLVRVMILGVKEKSGYTKIILDQSGYDSRLIPFKRGDIVDRNGTKMATSERVYNVILDEYVMNDNDDNVNPTLDILRDFFHVSDEKINEVLNDGIDSRYNIMATGISYEDAKEFEKIDEDDKNYPNVSGIWLENDYKRVYPYSTLASDVLGFSGDTDVGVCGLEASYNNVLNGTDGREYGYFTGKSSMEQTVKPAKDGNTIVTTIDVTLQSIVEQCIREFNEEHTGQVREGEPGSKNTAVIIMDPNSGEILAEASYPNFDLNNPEKIDYLYQENTSDGWTEEVCKLLTEEDWKNLTQEEQQTAKYRLWRNFCVSDAFEPGSTMKPFTVAAGLETGTLTGNETYVCGGYKHVGDHDIYCHLRTGHGTETVMDAIAYSCNVALMDMVESIGAENFIRYQHIFGFGEYTGIDLPGEAYTEPLLFTLDNMKPVDLATNSFGQSFNVTMTQMIAGFSSLINGGYYYEPHVVKQIKDEDGKVIETKDPVLLRKTISQETSVKIRQYMKAVMDYGTGTPADEEGYDIGAKTGTAEKLPRGEEKYVLSYIGYAPQDNPEVVIYVVIDEPNVPDQSTSRYVLDLAKRIMENAFPYLNITKEGEDTSAVEGTQLPEQQDYVDYDSAYEDTYNNPSGSYIDDSYTPDLDDWATGTMTE